MPPPIGPRPAARRGSKAALWAWLGAAAAVGVVVIVLVCAGGGRASLASLAAELPAFDRLDFVDLDVTAELGGEPLRDLGAYAGLRNVPREALAGLLPLGKRGVLAIAKSDTERMRIHCPRSLDEAALAKLLESCGYHKNTSDGAELWLIGPGGEEGVAVRKGRIYSGLTGTLKEVVLGKLALEKTMARREGCRELLRHLPASPAVVSLRKQTGGEPAGGDLPMPLWSVEDASLVGSRIEARMLGLFASVEAAGKAAKEVERGKGDIESDAKRGRDLPFGGAVFESVSFVQRGTVVIITRTLRRASGGGPGPAK